MNELLKVKGILEAQISVTKEMIETEKSILDEDSLYLQIKVREFESKIEAWGQTLRFVEKEIEYAERALEDLEIFKANTYETYFG